MNQDRSSLSALMRKANEKLIPISVLFEITHYCNLSCIHCYIVRNSKKKELSTQEIYHILDQLADAGCLFLILTGGEILTREDFFSIAYYAKAKNFALRFLTNGLLIDSESAEKIADIGPLSVEISIYGVRASTHDMITGLPGSFEKSVGALKLLKQRGVPIVLKTPLMKPNVSEYRQLIEMADELGAGSVVDAKIISRIDGSGDTRKLAIDDEDLHQVISDPLLEQRSNNASKQNRLGDHICAAARRTCCISPHGDVYPCGRLRIAAGNVTSQLFREIWQVSSLLHNIRSTRLSDLQTCAGCRDLPYCSPCIGLAFREGGKFTGKSPMTCRAAKIRRKIICATGTQED